MQNQKEMDLEYTKPLDEYTPQKELINEVSEYGNSYNSSEDVGKNKSSSKTIKKIMMFAAASLVTINVTMGNMFIPVEEPQKVVEEIVAEPVDEQVEEVKEEPVIEEPIIETPAASTKPVTENIEETKLEDVKNYAILKPHMEKIYEILQQDDADVALINYIFENNDEIQQAFREDTEENWVKGVYYAPENRCDYPITDMTQDKGFIFFLPFGWTEEKAVYDIEDAQILSWEIICADTKDFALNGELKRYYYRKDQYIVGSGIFYGYNCKEYIEYSYDKNNMESVPRKRTHSIADTDIPKWLENVGVYFGLQ